MRRDIEVVRQAITKVTNILAGRKVKVTQRGAGAWVKYNKAGVPTQVNIPYLPDNAGDDLIASVQGFIDHEVAHVLFTDPKAKVDKSAMNAKRIAVMHNIVEDCWIEPKMAKHFPGSRSNLSKVRNLVFRERGKAQIDEWFAMTGATEMPESVAVKYLLVTMLRALAGHDELVDLMDEYDYWRFFPTLLPKLKTFFPDEFKKCENSFDTLALARKVFEAIADPEAMPEDAGVDPDVDPVSGSGDDKDDDSDAEKTKSEKSDDGEPEKDDEKGKKEFDEKPDKKDEQGEDEEGEKKETRSGDEDSSKSDGDEETDGEDGDEEEGEDPDGKGESGAEDGDDTDEEAGEDRSTMGEPSELTASVDDLSDFESEMSGTIKADYVAAASHQDWLPFTSDYDEYPIYNQRSSASSYSTDLADSVRSLTGPMQKQLERLLLARRRSHFEPGRRSGRINPTALHRIKAQDDRIFRRKIEKRDKATAVHLVIDLSGSMGQGQHSRMGVAFQSAYALALTMERCRIPVMISGFTTKSLPSAVVKEMNATQSELGVRYSIYDEANYQPIFKTWNENVNHEVTARLADGWVQDPVRHSSSRNYNNMDPVSVEWAVRQTLRRSEERKIVIVLSDGQPAFGGDDWAAGRELVEVVKRAETNGVETIGIGIQTTSVERYYPKSVVINNTSELPATLMGELRKALLN